MCTALATSESRRSSRLGAGRTIAFAPGCLRRRRARLRNATHAIVTSLPRPTSPLGPSEQSAPTPRGTISTTSILVHSGRRRRLQRRRPGIRPWLRRNAAGLLGTRRQTVSGRIGGGWLRSPLGRLGGSSSCSRRSWRLRGRWRPPPRVSRGGSCYTSYRCFLAAAQTVQSHLAAHRFPCPKPILGPGPLEHGIAVVEELLDRGTRADAHDPRIRREMAFALARQVDLARPFVSLGDLRPSLLASPNPGQLWPEPHDARFDFSAGAAGAEWIDRFAAAARHRLAGTRARWWSLMPTGARSTCASTAA